MFLGLANIFLFAYLTNFFAYCIKIKNFIDITMFYIYNNFGTNVFVNDNSCVFVFARKQNGGLI